MTNSKPEKKKEPRKPFMTVLDYNIYVDPYNYTVEKGSRSVYYPNIEHAMAYINRDILNRKLTEASKEASMTLVECVDFIKVHHDEMKALWSGY